MTDIEALRARMREAAEKATPGPWTHYRNKLRPWMKGGKINEVQCGERTPIVAWGGFDDSNRPEAQHARNAKFIALASPANVKALDAEITRLREDLDRVTRERDEAHRTASGWKANCQAQLEETHRNMARAEAAEAALAVVTRERDDAIREVARLVKAREDAHGQWRSLAAERAVETSALKAALAKRDEEVARMRGTMQSASVYLRKLEDNMLANDADMMLDDCLPPSFHADQIDATLTKEPTNAE